MELFWKRRKNYKVFIGIWLKMILLLFWPINLLKILNVVRIANWNIPTFSQFCFQFAMKIIFSCRDCAISRWQSLCLTTFYAAVSNQFSGGFQKRHPTSNFIAKYFGLKELILHSTIKQRSNCYLCSFWISNFRRN